MTHPVQIFTRTWAGLLLFPRAVAPALAAQCCKMRTQLLFLQRASAAAPYSCSAGSHDPAGIDCPRVRIRQLLPLHKQRVRQPQAVQDARRQ